MVHDLFLLQLPLSFVGCRKKFDQVLVGIFVQDKTYLENAYFRLDPMQELAKDGRQGDIPIQIRSLTAVPSFMLYSDNVDLCGNLKTWLIKYETLSVRYPFEEQENKLLLQHMVFVSVYKFVSFRDLLQF